MRPSASGCWARASSWAPNVKGASIWGAVTDPPGCVCDRRCYQRREMARAASRSVLDDLQDVALLLFAAGRRHDGANRRGVRSALPDHLAEILLGDSQLENVSVLADHLLDLDLLRLVHERLNNRQYQRLHAPLRCRFDRHAGPARLGGNTSSSAEPVVYARPQVSTKQSAARAGIRLDRWRSAVKYPRPRGWLLVGEGELEQHPILGHVVELVAALVVPVAVGDARLGPPRELPAHQHLAAAEPVGA